MANLTELLERVEKATGPDRFLEERIFAWANGWSFPLYGSAISDLTSKERHGSIGYTRSLDAALALVEEKLPAFETADHRKTEVRLQIGDFGANAYLDRDTFSGGDSISFGAASTPALAVLSALLRALISQKEGVE